MNKHLGYGLLYIILLPFALLLGISTLIFLLASLQAPIGFLAVFIMACFVIYTIASLIFFIKAVNNNQPCKPSLRDWIRINAFVIIIPVIMLLIECIALIAMPKLITEIIAKMKTMQQEIPFSDTSLASIIKGWFYVLLVYSSAMLIHIIYTFRLLKKYRRAFGDYTDQDREIDAIGEENI